MKNDTIVKKRLAGVAKKEKDIAEALSFHVLREKNIKTAPLRGANRDFF